VLRLHTTIAALGHGNTNICVKYLEILFDQVYEQRCLCRCIAVSIAPVALVLVPPPPDVPWFGPPGLDINIPVGGSLRW
jgi:hypothetical protein